MPNVPNTPTNDEGRDPVRDDRVVALREHLAANNGIRDLEILEPGEMLQRTMTIAWQT